MNHQLFAEVSQALSDLLPHERECIDADAAEVAKTANRFRTKNGFGLRDGAISEAIRIHEIWKRKAKVEIAYRSFLKQLFLFGATGKRLVAESQKSTGGVDGY